MKSEKILMSCRDQSICRRLITKYGNDYDVFPMVIVDM